MMGRDYLFRGKRIDNGEWVYGFVLIMPTGTTAILEYCRAIYEKESQEYTVHIIIPETVGQFTGKLDVKQKKIFEGDKIKEDSNIAIVKFGNYRANNNNCYSNETAYGYYLEYLSHTGVVEHLSSAECWEIIGNIHDGLGVEGE